MIGTSIIMFVYSIDDNAQSTSATQGGTNALTRPIDRRVKLG